MPPLDRVAVIIPVYVATYLREALESVFAQTRPPDDVIVVDDGSPDREALRAALTSWRWRITVIHQANAGAAAARNTGIMATDAPWLAFLDADDRWLPPFLERQMAFVRQTPRLDLAWADAQMIRRGSLDGTFMDRCPSAGPVTLRNLLAQTCNVLTSTVVVRRDLVVNAGGFDPALRRGQDYDLWLRLLARGARAAYQKNTLAARRIHDANLSGSRVDELQRAMSVLQKALVTLPLTTDERDVAWRRVRTLTSELAREHGKSRLACGDFTAARQLLDAAHRDLPNWKLLAARVGVRLAPNLLRRLYLLHRAGESMVPATYHLDSRQLQ
jgi:glycosyltransferase involved in cell wall biosynthesis